MARWLIQMQTIIEQFHWFSGDDVMLIILERNLSVHFDADSNLRCHIDVVVLLCFAALRQLLSPRSHCW